jgi:hypothetical protein
MIFLFLLILFFNHFYLITLSLSKNVPSHSTRNNFFSLHNIYINISFINDFANFHSFLLTTYLGTIFLSLTFNISMIISYTIYINYPPLFYGQFG